MPVASRPAGNHLTTHQDVRIYTPTSRSVPCSRRSLTGLKREAVNTLGRERTQTQGHNTSNSSPTKPGSVSRNCKCAAVSVEHCRRPPCSASSVAAVSDVARPAGVTATVQPEGSGGVNKDQGKSIDVYH